MSLTKIGSEQWDFIDADGVQITLPPADAGAPAVRFPTRWRVFGPVKSRVRPIPPTQSYRANTCGVLLPTGSGGPSPHCGEI